MKSISPVSKRGSRARELPDLFNEIDLFSELDETASVFLSDKIELQTYLPGSIIFAPGSHLCEHLYILKQGRIEMYRLTAGGKRLVTRQISPGSMFGVRGLLGRMMQENFAEAAEYSTVYMITRDHFWELLKRQPDIALRILKAVCNRLNLLEERLVETVYNPVMVRLAYFLLTGFNPASQAVTNVTHEEIGNMIGAVRQTVTETLGYMRKKGLILTKRKHIQIVDRAGLEEIIRISEK